MFGKSKSLAKRVFIISTGSIVILSALYAAIIFWNTQSLKRISLEFHRKANEAYMQKAIQWNKQMLENLINGFGMWTKLYEKVKEGDTKWLEEMMAEDVQVQRSADSFGIYSEKGEPIFTKGPQPSPDTIKRLSELIKRKFPLGSYFEKPLFFFDYFGKEPYIIVASPLGSDDNEILSHDFLIFARKVKHITSLFKALHSRVVVGSAPAPGNRWIFAYPLKDLSNKTIAYINIFYPEPFKEKIAIMSAANFTFVIILLGMALALLIYYRKIYLEIKCAAECMLRAVESVNSYQANLEELKLLSCSENEIGQMAQRLMELLELTQSRIMLDPLTQVFNRGAFFTRLEEEIARSRRYKSPLSLCLLDLDDFKRINDTYGHPVGDEVLKELARFITENTRRFDVIGRVGGEEFGIIFPEIELKHAIAACEKLRGLLEEHTFTIQGIEIKVTASFGITSLKETDTITSLYERADKALYLAKAWGKNRVVELQ